MSRNLSRSAYSPVIYEMKDCSVGIFDAEGGLLGQAPGLPFFLGIARRHAAGGHPPQGPGGVRRGRRLAGQRLGHLRQPPERRHGLLADLRRRRAARLLGREGPLERRRGQGGRVRLGLHRDLPGGPAAAADADRQGRRARRAAARADRPELALPGPAGRRPARLAHGLPDRRGALPLDRRALRLGRGRGRDRDLLRRRPSGRPRVGGRDPGRHLPRRGVRSTTTASTASRCASRSR